MTRWELRRIDALCVSAWLLPRLEPCGVSRVFTDGRFHPWPGDPDDVAVYLTAAGYRVELRMGRRQGNHRETIVVVVSSSRTAGAPPVQERKAERP